MERLNVSNEGVPGRPGPRVIGRRTLYFPILGSTMDVAREEIRKGADAGTVIIAGEQTGGRGRVRRNWHSPGGNIAFSVILYPDIAALPYLIMLASVAVVRAIYAVTGLEAGIKWPNDVLIGGKKVSGILIENEIKGDGAASVIGIGINVAMNALGYQEIAATATGLNDAAGRDVPCDKVIKHVINEMDRLYAMLPQGDVIFREWRERLETLGKNVCVEEKDARLEGVAEAVDGSGALLLRLNDGSLARVVAGDIRLRQI